MTCFSQKVTTLPLIHAEPDVRGVLVWTIFLFKGPGPGRQVPCYLYAIFLATQAVPKKPFLSSVPFEKKANHQERKEGVPSLKTFRLFLLVRKALLQNPPRFGVPFGREKLHGQGCQSSSEPKHDPHDAPSRVVAFCSAAKSVTFSGLVENPLVGKKLKS